MYLCRHVNVIRRRVNVCHGFVPSCIRYFCHANVFHANACHAIMCHAIVASCKCLSCKRGHVNERHKSASSCVPSWLRKKEAIKHTNVDIEQKEVHDYFPGVYSEVDENTRRGLPFLC